ncbi:MAG: hypothetical protein UU08_C0009G0005 [Candidatus Uhrbacteria bacterium GW2011_GWE2_40_58]|nr:MAG: hypothetical protein UT94_C0017G0008 [Candidatus Uhrbacteria bacterium GW2011_GWF2_40_263]KKR67743.1 MAG: hypothetical protein UU08_C0009G0005 [Candidatus Uhrbacteria bacterium GW2011_GWE2_40_58]
MNRTGVTFINSFLINLFVCYTQRSTENITRLLTRKKEQIVEKMRIYAL